MQRSVAAVVLLAFGAGAADVFAFVQLRGVFTANMTGDLVLLGIPTRPEYAATLAGGTTALAAYAAVGYLGFRLTRGRTRGPLLLLAAVSAQLAVCALWAAARASVPPAAAPAVTALSATAMALQAVFTMRIARRAAASTTYITGTLTTLLRRVADGERGGRGAALGVVAAIPGGALAATAISAAAPVALPVLTAATLVAGGALALRAERRDA